MCKMCVFIGTEEQFSHQTSFIIVCNSAFLYLEERDSLGRGSCKTELQLAKHILQQENQLGRTQQNLLSHLNHVRILEVMHNILYVDVCGAYICG